jgi:hypothetical protein
MATMTVSKSRRLVNPGRKRKLSALQKLFFGSKRQRAAVARKGNPKRRKATYQRATGKRKTVSYRKRKRNVGHIVTVLPAGLNPGRRKRRFKKNAKNRLVIVNGRSSMAKGSGRVISGYGSTVMNKGRKRMAKRRTRRVNSHRVTRRRRRNPVYRGRIRRGMYKYSSNPRRRRSYSRRRRNPGVTRHHRRYRRNPFGIGGSGIATKVLGVIGGVAVTKLLCGFLPATFQTGIMGYAATAAIAVLQGKLVGKFSKSPQLGTDMMVGGLAYLTAKVLNDFLPSIGSYTGIAGIGLIGPSSFYTPQVNRNNSMGAFMVPQAVTGYVGANMPAPVAHAGVGRLRRTGRL